MGRWKKETFLQPFYFPACLPSNRPDFWQTFKSCESSTRKFMLRLFSGCSGDPTYLTCPVFYLPAERSGCCNKGRKMSLPAMSDVSRRAFAAPRSDRSTITNAVGTRSQSDNTQGVIGQANADAEELCETCHEPISLSERSVKLPACRHVFHDDCHRNWIDTATNHNLPCPTCCVPTTRINSSRDDATHSYVHRITKKDLFRPEPLISAPMLFHVGDGQHPVLAALAFKHYPSVCAQPRNSMVALSSDSAISVVTDKGVGRLEMGTDDADSLSLYLLSVALPAYAVKKTKSFLLQKAKKLLNYFAGIPANLRSVQHCITLDDHLENKQGGTTIWFHPGIPLKSFTFWCNTWSLLSYLVTCGTSDCWMFPDSKKLDIPGEQLTCINYLRKSITWQPVVGSVNSDSDTNENTFDQRMLDDAKEVVVSQLGWRNRLTLDLLVSCSPDGRCPFARLSDITFSRSNRLSGCLVNCLDMDQLDQTDDSYYKFQQDFDRGIEALADDQSSIYLHLSMR